MKVHNLSDTILGLPDLNDINDGPVQLNPVGTPGAYATVTVTAALDSQTLQQALAFVPPKVEYTNYTEEEGIMLGLTAPVSEIVLEANGSPGDYLQIVHGLNADALDVRTYRRELVGYTYHWIRCSDNLIRVEAVDNNTALLTNLTASQERYKVTFRK